MEKAMRLLKLILMLPALLPMVAIADVSPEAKRLVGEYDRMLNSRFTLLPHRQTYLLPISYNAFPNNAPFKRFIAENELASERGPFVDHLEAEFQISFMVLTNRNILGTKFNTFLGYTHQSWWQVYNADWSKPFRETNYMPEVFGRWVLDEPLSFGKISVLAFDIGYIHQSNGQIQEVSRSWDRIVGRMGLAIDNVFVMLSGWYRLPEDAKVDDNPDIHKYLGYGEVALRYRHGGHNLSAILRPGEKYFGGDLTYSYPIKLGLRLFTKITAGYGSSLLDYNHHVERYALGMSLSDPFTPK